MTRYPRALARSGLLALTAATILLTPRCASNSAPPRGMSPPPSETAAGESPRITPEGGTFEVLDASHPCYGARVEIPGGAVTGDITVTATAASDLPPLPEGVRAAGPAIDFGPDGLEFAEPVLISLPCDAEALADPDSLVPYTYNAHTGTWGVTTSLFAVDTARSCVDVVTTHFSIRQVGKVTGPQRCDPNDPNTRFDIERHAFPMKNWAEGDQGGFCLGMVAFAKWYFDNYGKSTNCTLADIDRDTLEEIARRAQAGIRSFPQSLDYAAWTIQWRSRWRIDLLGNGYVNAMNVARKRIAQCAGPQIVLRAPYFDPNTPEAPAHSLLATFYDPKGVYVYDPTKREQGAHILKNEEDRLYCVVSLAEVYGDDYDAFFEGLRDEYWEELRKGCPGVSASIEVRNRTRMRTTFTGPGIPGSSEEVVNTGLLKWTLTGVRADQDGEARIEWNHAQLETAGHSVPVPDSIWVKREEGHWDWVLEDGATCYELEFDAEGWLTVFTIEACPQAADSMGGTLPAGDWHITLHLPLQLPLGQEKLAQESWLQQEWDESSYKMELHDWRTLIGGRLQEQPGAAGD